MALVNLLPVYQAVFQEETDGGYSVWVPDLPGCTSQGETIEEAMSNIKEAIALYLEGTDHVIDSVDSDYKRQFVVPLTLTHA
jgi:predicted RNase H-like HicB family nuclease